MNRLKSTIKTVTAFVIFVSLTSFYSNDSSLNQMYKIRELHKKALTNSVIGKSYIVDLAKNKNCNKTKVTYLGVLSTKNKKFKVLSSFFVFGSSCRGSSSIRFYDMRNRYIGEYNVGMPHYLPNLLKENILFFPKNEDCNLRKKFSINFKNGFPKNIYVPCSSGGDVFTFSSY